MSSTMVFVGRRRCTSTGRVDWRAAPPADADLSCRCVCSPTYHIGARVGQAQRVSSSRYTSSPATEVIVEPVAAAVSGLHTLSFCKFMVRCFSGLRRARLVDQHVHPLLDSVLFPAHGFTWV